MSSSLVVPPSVHVDGDCAGSAAGTGYRRVPKRARSGAVGEASLGLRLFALFDSVILGCIFSFFDAHLAAYLCRVSRATLAHAKHGVLSFAAHNRLQLPFSHLRPGTYCERFRGFSSLAALNLNDCVHFTDQDAIVVASMPFAPLLHTLDLSKTRVGNEGLAALAAVCTRLTALRLSHLTGVQDVSAMQVVQNNPGLTFLDLSVTSVLDDTIRMVASTCTALRFLDLSWVQSTNDSLAVLARDLTSVRSLRVPMRATAEGIDQVSLLMTGLTSLGLVAMPVTDDALIRCGQRLTNLVALHLAQVELVSDRGLEGFAEHHSKMRLLQIRKPGMLVSDRGLGHFLRRSPTLHTLKLRAAPRITDLSLESIGFNVASSIEVLELNSMCSMSYATVFKLLQSATRIRSLHIDGCQHITSDQSKVLMQIANSRQVLADISAAFMPRR